MTVYVLVECAVGIVLLKAVKCNSIDHLSETLNHTDFDILKSKFEIIKFSQFDSTAEATDFAFSLASSQTCKSLNKMLKKIKDENPILVCMDKKLCDSIKSQDYAKCFRFSAESNIIFKLRTLRFNVHKLVGYSDEQIRSAQNGLATSYSRSRIQYNDSRSDSMVIQSICLLDQQDKVINQLSMKIREWFGYHFPELYKIVGNNEKYCKIIKIIKSRHNAFNYLDEITEIVEDTSKANSIIEISKMSVGFDLTDRDYDMILQIANDILMNIKSRNENSAYLSRRLQVVAPNFSTLVGDVVAARLIAHAGSLLNLAKNCPASTIQILGAEKALFKAIKSKSKTPKYGLLYHSNFVTRAPVGDKGRISRFLAAKIALAVRLDVFSDAPNNIYGSYLKKECEDHLEFLKSGNEQKRNREVMAEAHEEVMKLRQLQKTEENQVIGDVNEIKVQTKKKKSKTHIESLTVPSEEIEPSNEHLEETKGKKKKKKKSQVEPIIVEPIEEVKDNKKKKSITEPIEKLVQETKIKKKKSIIEPVQEPVKEESVTETKVKKKKNSIIESVTEPVIEESGEKIKKKKKSLVEPVKESTIQEPVEEIRKKKKSKNIEPINIIEPNLNPTEKDKKKKSKSNFEVQVIEEVTEKPNLEQGGKKKKKKSKNIELPAKRAMIESTEDVNIQPKLKKKKHSGKN